MLEKFKDLSSFFKKDDIVDSKRKEIVEKIDYYINEDMLDLVMEYRLNDYLLTPLQSKIFHKKYDKVKKSKKVDFLYDILSKKRSISNEIIIEFFHSFSEEYSYYKENSKKSIIYTYEMRKDTALIMEEYKKRVEDKYFSFELQKYLISKIEKLIAHKKYKSHFEIGYYVESYKNEQLAKEVNLYTDIVLPNMSLQQTKLFLEKLTKLNKIHSHNYQLLFEDSFNQLQDNYKKLIELEIKRDAESMKFLFSENRDKSIDESLEEIYLQEKSCNKVQALPANIKTLLDTLTNNYITLKNSIDTLNTEENFQIKNLMEKRVPEILNLYLKCDSKYRKEMKNTDGQNIEDLTIGSLKDINQVFNKICEQRAERVLHNASALRRYTKTL